MPSIFYNMINLVLSIEIRGLSSRLMDITVLESGARNNHVLCGSERYHQFEAIVACFPVQTVFPDCWKKNIFSHHFRVKIAYQNFNIGSKAYVIQNFTSLQNFFVKGILRCVLCRRMGTYKPNVKIFCLNADGG